MSTRNKTHSKQHETGSEMNPRITTLRVPGTTLTGNPLGDPAEREVPVYLPPSYDGKKRFGVIYLLSGFASTGRSFMNYSFGHRSVPESAEQLIADGRMKECLIVMPDCMTSYGGSQYVDSPATGRYETYLVNELIPFIDNSLQTLQAGEHRAIAGKSSGGFGALRLAMKYPHCFSAASCHSGDMHFELCYKPGFPAAARILEKHKGDISAFYRAYTSSPKPARNDFPLLELLAMAAAYSPDTLKHAPENMRLPCDPYTCEINITVWKEWLTFDPLVMIEEKAYQEALSSLKLLYLDCGSYDEYNLAFAHRLFSRKASGYGIAHHYEEFPDSHSDTSYRYDTSLPLLSAAIAL